MNCETGGGQEEGAKKITQKVFSVGIMFVSCGAGAGIQAFFLFGLAAGFRLPEWPSGLPPPGSRLLWKQVEVASERV